MNVENNRNNTRENNPNKTDAETWFHILFGWFAALSAMIAVAALAVVS